MTTGLDVQELNRRAYYEANFTTTELGAVIIDIVACPICFVPKGERCRKTQTTGDPYTYIHTTRRYVAMARLIRALA